LFRPGALPGLLPPGLYRFANAPHDLRLATLAFVLGSYRFGRYRKTDASDVRLVPSEGIDAADIMRMADAAALARDLINTPSNDMGPEELAQAAQALATRFGASFSCITGDELLRQNFPLIHAVGMASPRAPRLIDFSWGDPEHPKVTLVGKGVCFDTGGLDLKPSSGMLIMKKDMGGAANVLALAQMVMDAKLKVRLRVLIPAVENAVAGNAFRPLDIFKSRNGLTVEIGNTDAEGRLVLADALALACEEKPDLLVDLGTLTGAARVALGPDLPPFYSNDETLAEAVARCAKAENDPLWRMPLWPPYDSWLDSKTADVNNAPSGGFAGSIICALFLQRFVAPATRWLHVDIYGWTPSAKPARPEGGECQAARAIYKLLSERYG
jgi:leucyl aminopeptidase